MAELAPGPVPTLKRRAEFVKLSKGLRRSARAFSLQAMPAAEAQGRFGFTVTKKVGKATERNRMRRRLKAAAATLPVAGAAVDVVLVARRECLSQPFAELSRDLAEQFAAARRRLADSSAAPRRPADTPSQPARP